MINCQSCTHNKKATRCKANHERPYLRFKAGIVINLLRANCGMFKTIKD